MVRWHLQVISWLKEICSVVTIRQGRMQKSFGRFFSFLFKLKKNICTFEQYICIYFDMHFEAFRPWLCFNGRFEYFIKKHLHISTICLIDMHFAAFNPGLC